MDDLINRKTVINGLDYIITELDKLIEEDPLNAEYHHTKKQVEEIKNGVQNLPTEQPEVIRCKDCKYNGECSIQFVANADDKFFCGAGERRQNE